MKCCADPALCTRLNRQKHVIDRGFLMARQQRDLSEKVLTSLRSQRAVLNQRRWSECGQEDFSSEHLYGNWCVASAFLNKLLSMRIGICFDGLACLQYMLLRLRVRPD